MRLSRIAIVLIIFLSGITKIAAQDVAIKTNGLYWLAGGTINGGVEVATSNRVTLQLSGSYNPWTYRNDKKNALLACRAGSEVLVVRKI